MEPKQRQFSVRYSVIAIAALSLIEGYLFAPRPETLAYSDFVKLVKAGKVSDVRLSSHAIAGTLAKLLLDKEVVTADALRALLRDPAYGGAAS